MSFPPDKIVIKSDGNVLTFVEIKKPTYVYKYTKSISKKNQLLGLTETELLKLINTNSP